jgi:diguanylate cyclase (GGDEF)-like protein
LNLERSLKKANEEIRKLTVTDPLTGCYNRGFVNERLARDLKRAERYGRRFSLILCDIDHFKTVNDTYGHRAGDMVLKMFVDRVQQSIRQKVDWLARYGGEEFLVGLPETGPEGARDLAERLRSEISGKRMRIEDAEITITASFGIADFDPRVPEKRVTPDTLIARADKFLYRAKREGRNRIRTATVQ